MFHSASSGDSNMQRLWFIKGNWFCKICHAAIGLGIEEACLPSGPENTAYKSYTMPTLDRYRDISIITQYHNFHLLTRCYNTICNRHRFPDLFTIGGNLCWREYKILHYKTGQEIIPDSGSVVRILTVASWRTTTAVGFI